MSQTEQGRQSGREQFLAELKAFAQTMDTDGPFFFGDEFSLVDIAMAPFYQRFLWVGSHYRPTWTALPDDDADIDRLRRWWDAVSARPSVRDTFVDKRRLIESYAQYADGSATSNFAKSMGSKLRAVDGGDTPGSDTPGSDDRACNRRVVTAHLFGGTLLGAALAAGVAFAVAFNRRGGRT